MSQPDATKPNVLYIMCDELRWCGVGCYGHPVVQTPHIDALARRGVRVEHAVSNAPVCMAARTLVLSGQHPRTSAGHVGNPSLRFRRDSDGGRGWCFDAYAPPQKVGFFDPTVPQLLRVAGYQLRAVGKWHVDAWPHEIGFDDYLIPHNHHAHSAQPFTHNGGPEFCPEGFSVDFEAEEVCRFLASDQSKETPWFMYYNISPPHMPLADMPRQYLEMYDRSQTDFDYERPNYPKGFSFSDDTIATYLWDYRNYLHHLPHANSGGKDMRDLIALYYGATTWVDDKVGEVMKALDDAGLADDTLVIFTADHGEMLGCHGRSGKATLYEESCRVPFIAAGCGIPADTVASDGVASLVDVGPTALSVAGAEVPDHLHGTDLLPMLRGEATGPDAAIIETEGDGTGIRTTTHLLGLPRIDRDFGETPHKFFDLREDPYQLQSLSPTEDFAKLLERRVRDFDAKMSWFENPDRAQRRVIGRS
jgi:choline-sulfatase